MLCRPAVTTATGVCDISIRSAETSQELVLPCVAPPMAPVTSTGMPARWARKRLAETVVAAVAPRISRPARSRRTARCVLAHAGERREFLVGQPDSEAALPDRDDREDRPFLLGDGLHPAGDVEVVGLREAVGDGGGGHRDHGPTGLEGVGYQWADIDRRGGEHDGSPERGASAGEIIAGAPGCQGRAKGARVKGARRAGGFVRLRFFADVS